MMDRRGFLKLTGAAALVNLMEAVPGSCGITADLEGRRPAKPVTGQAVKDGMAGVQLSPEKDQLTKTRLFDEHFQDDYFLSRSQMPLLVSSLERFKRIQRLIGYGNFCIAGFDDAVTYARSYSRVGRFTKQELEFLEEIFYSPAREYGFLGEKTIPKMTAVINRKKTKKIPRTGNYLFKGKPVTMYKDIQKKIGQDAVLTSGIRGVIKQFLLFLNKAAASQGNLSMASRSLAPPGYSFHGTGDFDVGEKGFGVDNFTEKFTQTRVYNQLSDLGYIKFRYDRTNNLGVRFEPWHVEVG
ncbi:MAG: M15 family metallopeptidase [Desulfobacterales bacterium]|nr:M15 family metallopeptidase [Desulfobacterales bacterium]